MPAGFRHIVIGVAAVLLLPHWGADSRADAVDGSERTFDTRNWARTEPGRKAYLVTAGAFEGERLIRTVEAHPEAESLWIVRLEKHNRLVCRRTDGGGLTIVEDLDFRRDKRTRFDPGLWVLPPEMAIGQTVHRRGRTRVFNPDSGLELADGTYDQTIQLVGRRTVETPAGRFDGFHVRSASMVNTSLADVTVTVDTVFVPEVGPVYEHVKLRIVTLGLFTSESRREMKLAER